MQSIPILKHLIPFDLAVYSSTSSLNTNLAKSFSSERERESHGGGAAAEEFH